MREQLRAGAPHGGEIGFVFGTLTARPGRHDPRKDSIFEFRPDGSAGAGPDAWKARLDVMKLATESGKRADF